MYYSSNGTMKENDYRKDFRSTFPFSDSRRLSSSLSFVTLLMNTDSWNRRNMEPGDFSLLLFAIPLHKSCLVKVDRFREATDGRKRTLGKSSKRKRKTNKENRKRAVTVRTRQTDFIVGAWKHALGHLCDCPQSIICKQMCETAVRFVRTLRTFDQIFSINVLSIVSWLEFIRLSISIRTKQMQINLRPAKILNHCCRER